MPMEEYFLAEAALQAAQDAQAARHASGVWFEAEQSYRGAVKAYEQRDYDRATRLFLRARKVAEEAELIAREEMAKSGDFTL